jgi:hypothetical protein
MPPATYKDPAHYETACALWESQDTIFACKEDERLEELEKRIEHSQNCPGLGCLALIISIAIGVHSGALMGWTVFGLFSVVVLPFHGWCKEKFIRHRLRHELVRRVFDVPRPILVQDPYQDSALPPQEPPPPQEEEPLDAARVTSMRQAFAILEIPPGRTTLAQAHETYRRKISQYHPDRVAHLGPELRELAAKKTLQINLAWAFIQEHRSTTAS